MGLQEHVRGLLSQLGHQFTEADGQWGKQFVLAVRGRTELYTMCLLDVHEQNQVVKFRVMLEFTTPAEKWWEVMDFVTQASCGLTTTCLEMDGGQMGLVRARSGIDIEGGTLTPRMLHNLIGTTLRTAEKYHGGLRKVITGSLTPAQAIAEIDS